MRGAMTLHILVHKGSGSSPRNEIHRESIVPLGLLVKMRVRSVKKDNLVMRQCAKSLGPHGISRVVKAHLSCCETRNELCECESGAQIGAFSLTDFYSWPILEAIRQLAYP